MPDTELMLRRRGAARRLRHASPSGRHKIVTPATRLLTALSLFSPDLLIEIPTCERLGGLTIRH